MHRLFLPAHIITQQHLVQGRDLGCASVHSKGSLVKDRSLSLAVGILRWALDVVELPTPTLPCHVPRQSACSSRVCTIRPLDLSVMVTPE